MAGTVDPVITGGVIMATRNKAIPVSPVKAIDRLARGRTRIGKVSPGRVDTKGRDPLNRPLKL